jgi:putative transcriptional regulator
LLVATPALIDPNFFRTVVLVIEHNDEGAAGVVLNRPSEMELRGGPLEGWSEVAAHPPLVFVGGPVQPTDAFCLARVEQSQTVEGWSRVVDGIGLVDLNDDAARTSVERLRVFAGYAGWGPGQLEGEIDEGSWFVLEAEPEDALSADPVTLWRVVLKRQGGNLSLVSNFPIDPTMN